MSILSLHYFSFTIILIFFWVKKGGGGSAKFQMGALESLFNSGPSSRSGKKKNCLEESSTGDCPLPYLL